MKQKILNYLIIIEPDQRTGSNELCYSVYCPSLGLVDSGDTIAEAKSNMEAMIKFHLECLVDEDKAFAFRDHFTDAIVATAQVKASV